jgi:hypothetical protein
MKIIAAFLTIIVPALASAQQGSNNSAPCPLSHWSTTGAACDYAPDLPPTIDSELKMGVPLWDRNDSLTLVPRSYNYLLPDGYVPPPSPNPFLKMISDSITDEMMHDPVIQQFIRQMSQDSTESPMFRREFMRQLLEDSTEKRILKPQPETPDPVLPH